MGWECSSVGKCRPSKYEALDSAPQKTRSGGTHLESQPLGLKMEELEVQGHP